MATKKLTFKRILFIILLVAGALYFSLTALRNMFSTAVYVHQTIPVKATITDIRQRPFESMTEALKGGNLSMGGSIAYFPIVSFQFDNGATISQFALTDADNEPCHIGDPIEVRTYPYDPGAPEATPWRPEGVHPNRAAYLWGGDALSLLFGILLGALTWLMLRPYRRTKTTELRKTEKETKPKKSTSTPAKPKKQQPQQAQEEEPFSLSAEPEPVKKKRTPRQKKETDPNAPPKPRAPRKKKEVDSNAPPKPRRTRKKKSDPPM